MSGMHSSGNRIENRNRSGHSNKSGNRNIYKKRCRRKQRLLYRRIQAGVLLLAAVAVVLLGSIWSIHAVKGLLGIEDAETTEIAVTQAKELDYVVSNGTSEESDDASSTTSTSTLEEADENATEEQELPNAAYLDVAWINQNPELPTGCEITSLTTVLQYYGYQVSKTTMASSYLETGEGSFFERFIGNPFSTAGYGCMAQPIVNAANKYLSDVGSDAEAINVSNSEFTDLLQYVAAGDPVVIWNTMYMLEPYVSESFYVDGEWIAWVAQEHCVVLIGYDISKDVVYISDPLEGIVTRDMSDFIENYEAVYAQAVVIQ